MTNKTRISIQEKIKNVGNSLFKNMSNFWRGKLIKPAPSYWAMIPVKIENRDYKKIKK